MAVTFTTTIGGASSNSYISVEDADDYFLIRYADGGWSALTTANKQRALMAATRAIDKRMFIGNPASQTQRLKFPRNSVPKPNNEMQGIYVGDGGYGVGGHSVLYNYYLTTEIPAPIKDATCEMAIAIVLLNAPESSSRRLRSFSIDSQSFVFESDGRNSATLPAEVEAILHPLLMPARRERM